MINNYLSSAGFKIIFKRLPHVEFFSNKILLPSVTTNAVKSDTPLRAYYSVGDHLNYADLDLTFIIDENMGNYREIFEWLKGIGTPDNLEQYDKLKNSADGDTSDVTVLILDSHKQPNLEVTYINAMPIGLTPVSLDLSNQDVIYPEATVTMRYDAFDIKKLD
tara:strand:- start:676 stop:1164 length:489 start_codon:yes stop_codon:yes gene_type:complete